MRIKQKVKWGEQAEKQQGELADAVRQLTSMLDGLEIHEAKSDIVQSRSVQCSSPIPKQRVTKLSMKSGANQGEWKPMPVTSVIEGETVGAHFSWRAWVGTAMRIDVDRTDEDMTRYLSINADGSGYTWVASMPDQQPEDAVVFDLMYTYGDIHLPGLFDPEG